MELQLIIYAKLMRLPEISYWSTDIYRRTIILTRRRPDQPFKRSLDDDNMLFLMPSL